MLILVALTVAVRRVSGGELSAGLFAVKNRPDFAAQIAQMVIVHETAEVQHIRIVALRVEAVQNGNEPDAEGREHIARIPSHFHKVAPQTRKVFDENQVDNAVPGVLQHFLKSGTLEIRAGISVIDIGFRLHPSVYHNEFGKHFPLVLNADGFVGGNIVFGFGGVMGVIHAQAAVNADAVQLFHAVHASVPTAPLTSPT